MACSFLPFPTLSHRCPSLHASLGMASSAGRPVAGASGGGEAAAATRTSEVRVADQDRVRAPRLYPRHAKEVIEAVWDIAGVVNRVPLALADLMAAAAAEDDGAWQARWASRPESHWVRSSLAFKVRTCLAKGMGPLCLWLQPCEALPAGLAKDLWQVWTGLDRTSLGKRREEPEEGGERQPAALSAALLQVAANARKRGLAFGKSVCALPDVAIDGWLDGASSTPIRVRMPHVERPGQGALGELLPAWQRDDGRHSPRFALVLQRVKALRLTRAFDIRGPPQLFSLGALDLAVKKWRAERAGRAGSLPPSDVLGQCLHSEVTPTLLASSNGRLWDAKVSRPLCTRQVLAVGGMLHEERIFTELAKFLTAQQFAAAFGMGVHPACVHRVLVPRIRARMGSKWEGLRSFSAWGAGINLLGLALFRAHGNLSYLCYAETHPKVAKGHDILWGALGQRPRHFTRAEAVPMEPRLAADAELITLSCGPFSAKNHEYPQGCWAAIRELRLLMRGVRARRPKLTIYENTSGLWERGFWRKAVERVLRERSGRRSTRYSWEATRCSPHVHGGAPVKRDRVFYIGFLED